MTRVRKVKNKLRRSAQRARVKYGRTAEKESPRARRTSWQILICGTTFVLLVAMKILLPGNLASFRATLGEWLVRDADFVAAFHAVGEAVGGTRELGESLGAAYEAVFGAEEAVEVLGGEEVLISEQEILGFSFLSPLDGTVTSAYGLREDPQSGVESMHYGVDIAAEEGTDIRAFADGTVSVVGESAVQGKYLTVQHENGCETLYAHCSAVSVRSGDAVSMGDVIAQVGSTGNATGPHLHFELQRNGVFLNPARYVFAQ